MSDNGNYQQGLVTSQAVGTGHDGKCIELGASRTVLQLLQQYQYGSGDWQYVMQGLFASVMPAYVSSSIGDCFGPGPGGCSPQSWPYDTQASWIGTWWVVMATSNVTSFGDTPAQNYPSCLSGSLGGAPDETDCHFAAPLYDVKGIYGHAFRNSGPEKNDVATGPEPTNGWQYVAGDGGHWEKIACELGGSAMWASPAGEEEVFNVQASQTKTWNVGLNVSTFGTPFTASISIAESWSHTSTEEEQISETENPGSGSWIVFGQSPDWHQSEVLYSGPPLTADQIANQQTQTRCNFDSGFD